MPEDKPNVEPSSDEGEKTPIPRWDIIDNISGEIEKIFFTRCQTEGLSPYEASLILHRVNMLFDEYKIVIMSQFSQDKPNVDFKGTNIYK